MGSVRMGEGEDEGKWMWLPLRRRRGSKLKICGEYYGPPGGGGEVSKSGPWLRMKELRLRRVKVRRKERRKRRKRRQSPIQVKERKKEYRETSGRRLIGDGRVPRRAREKEKNGQTTMKQKGTTQFESKYP